MKIKPGFELRNVAGEHVLVATGMQNIDFSKIISMNSSAAYLWRAVADIEYFDAAILASLLVKEYEISQSKAEEDAAALLKGWLQAGIVA